MSTVVFIVKVAVLAGFGPDLREAAFLFGKNLGIAFQLVDDILDFEADASELGKPAGSDLRAGIATAPVFFAAQKVDFFSELIL